MRLSRLLGWVSVSLLLWAALLLGGVKAFAQSAVTCDQSVVYDASTSGSTRLVTASTAPTRILICGYSFFSAGTVNLKLVYGTGTACATGTVSLTPAYQFTAQTGLVDQSAYWRGMQVPASTDFCINASAGTAAQAIVYYTLR